MFTEKRFLPIITLGRAEKEKLAKAIAEFLVKEPNIVFAYLHGSFIADDAFRDIDVAIFVNAPGSFDVESELSRRLSAHIGHEVEVKIINRAPIAFQAAPLLSGALLFSKDEELRADFIEKAGKKYREYAHFRNIFLEAVGAE